MNAVFYPKLAWDGIRKNKQLYIPYIITCIGMVMMYYIVYFLSYSSAMENVPGAYTICSMLDMGSKIIALFSLLFLFYSNSFLMRRRKREFGLYNILGMGKWNISRILFWEVLIVAGFALVVGLGLGIALSKLFELALINMMKGEVSFAFTVSTKGILSSAMIFGAIFMLLFLNALRQISLSNPVELLRSESAGEKPPKANWLGGVLGLLLLGGAYYIALNIKDPVSALSYFFVAVFMVIVASYLLFISSSVLLCRILQKNKRYYYKPNHFISVSSMTYRMKRNGAGLASICILLTMVLVMLSSTMALFVGAEDSIRVRYPKDINMKFHSDELQDISTEKNGSIQKEVKAILDAHGASVEIPYDYRTIVTSGYLQNGVMYNNRNRLDGFQQNEASEITMVFFVSISDYNQLMGENKELGDHEVLICPFRTKYSAPTFQVNGGEIYNVKEVVNTFISNGDSAMTIFPTVFVFVRIWKPQLHPWSS